MTPHDGMILLALLLLAVAVVSLAHAQDPVALGDCLSTLNRTNVQVWTVSDGQQFALRPLMPGEYDALAAMPVTEIWRGYDQETRWDWPGSDYPGWWGVQIIYQWRNVESVNHPGLDITFYIVWSDHDPNNVYLFPLKPDFHGLGHGCTLYRAPLVDVVSDLGEFVEFPSYWRLMQRMN